MKAQTKNLLHWSSEASLGGQREAGGGGGGVCVEGGGEKKVYLKQPKSIEVKEAKK